MDTGTIIIPSVESGNRELNQLLLLRDGWITQRLPQPESLTQVYKISSTQVFPKSQSDDTKLEALTLGDVKDLLRFMAIIRIEPYWFGCTQDKDFFHLENDATMACFLTASGHGLCILALSADDDLYTILQSDQLGAIVVGGRNDGPREAPLMVLAAVSLNIQHAIAAVMDQARKTVAQRPKMHEFLASKKTLPAHTTREFFDSFGYCTYNGIGTELTDAKIFSGLDTLSKNGVEFNTLIIDDNWQTVGNTLLDFSNRGFRGWSRFEANSEGFPGGLGALIREIKRKYPRIRYVGVWHALLGYWAGLAHDSSFAEKYKLRKTVAKVRGNVPTDVIVVDPSDVHRFYDDFYGFLRSSGVDFVKTDVQHMLSMFVNPEDRSDIPGAYQSAWTDAYLRHFDGKAISCMSLVPQVSLHSFLQFETPPILLRNSDDFFPEIPDSHPFHLFVNAHNALLTKHLNCIPDWDMFQTSHPYSSYHAAARCLSGGPALITDIPGEHSNELISQMIAITPSGNQIALRPRVATTVNIWDNFADGHVLKIRTYTKASVAMMGVFNIAKGQKEVFLTLKEFFPSSKSTPPCLVRSFSTGQIFVPKTDAARLLQVKLDTRGWDVLSAIPLIGSSSHKTLRFACLGLLDKITGAAGMISCNLGPVSAEEVVALTRLKALGRAGFFFAGDIELRRVECRGNVIGDQYVATHELDEDGRLAIIDLEAFWLDGSPRHHEAEIEISLAFSTRQ